MVSMEIYQSCYYNNARKLAHLVGLWPWQRSKYIFRGFYGFGAILSTIPLVVSLIKTKDPVKRMENMYAILLSLGAFMKICALVLAEKKVKLLYENIAQNWKTIVEENERKILIKHSDIGRKAAYAFTSFYTFTYVAFTLLPWVPIILNIVDPLPKPRPYIYIVRADYGLENQDAYYYYFYTFDFVRATSMMGVTLSVDPMYATCVEHFVALYAIIAYRLRKLKHMVPDGSSKRTNASYGWLVETIKIHQNILSFTSTLKSSYSVCFLTVILGHLFSIPLTCVLFLASSKEKNIIDVFRYGTLFVCLAIHLFVSFWPAQRLQEYSSKLFHDAYLNKWYQTSENTKKLLKIIMLRSKVPSTLTAGSLITMNLENYYRIMKMAISYITVFASFQ